MNRINHKNSRWAFLAISGLFAASLCTVGNVAAGSGPTGEIQVGRYQTVLLQADQTQVDLLSVVVTRKLPTDINTVGEAVAVLLDGSGYRLLGADLAEPYRAVLFALPLPEVQRQLGPLRLRQALELLTGPAFRLVIDPTYRLVTFELVAMATTSEAGDCSGE
jgi:conjugative transfer region protein (TIGR03748 family)